MTIRIMVADDHKLVRAGLTMLVDEIAGYEVIAEADDGLAVLAKVEELHPDLILMDIQMPGLSGLDCLAQLRVSHPEIKILMLSMHANEEHVRRALDQGALGYLLKDATPTELELALKTVMSGNVWLSAMISPHVLGREITPSKDHGQGVELTPRQQVVMKRLAEGASIKEIAYELELSVKTVETYRTQIMERLDLSDLPALVRYAIRNGIINL